jgi:hypothetical protein
MFLIEWLLLCNSQEYFQIYVATDSSPVDMQSYELCCDMIDVVIDVSCIYGLGRLIIIINSILDSGQ